MAAGVRRIARETALQFLYQEDLSQAEDGFGQSIADRFPQFCTLYKVNRKARSYSEELLRGVCTHLGEIDSTIEGTSTNWRLARLSAVDRNILRIAVYEMMYGKGVPGQVAINEAVEVAKRFSAEDSPSFINGLLDAVFLSLNKGGLE